MNWPSLSLLGQSILSGIFIGALYGLFGLGLSLSWGLLRLINLAHFALAFLGAYLAYQLSSSGAMDPLLTLLVIVPGFFLFGMAMHWVFMRFAVSPFNSLLVTFGITPSYPAECFGYVQAGAPLPAPAAAPTDARVIVIGHMCPFSTWATM